MMILVKKESFMDRKKIIRIVAIALAVIMALSVFAVLVNVLGN